MLYAIKELSITLPSNCNRFILIRDIITKLDWFQISSKTYFID
jgi:hypothetical protein